MPQPVAYIRRSVARRGDPGDVSREFQTEKVRALANGDGPTLRIIDGDWGRSASTDKTAQRTAFLSMLVDIEQGRVSHVYAYSPDRLARSVEWSARLVNACRRAGASITTTAGTVAPDDPAARAMFNMLAVMNENALDEMERKAKASAGTRKDHGEATGGRCYGEVRTLKSGEVRGGDEDAALVVATFHEAGSYFGAARLLNERHVPARSGGQWYPRTVQRIVNRQDSSTARHSRRGVRSVSPLHRLAGLLHCHCGAIMGQTVSGEGTPRYRCPNGVADASHSRPYIVPERALLPWVKAEAARLRVPSRHVLIGQAASKAERDDLTEQRRLAAIAFTMRAFTEDELAATVATIDAELAKLDSQSYVANFASSIDWTEGAAHVNESLRALFEYIELGPDLRPVRAEWAVKEWRAE